MQLDEMTPEQHRQRYLALRDAARAIVPPDAAADHFAESRVLRRESVPAGWYHSIRLARGQALRLLNTHGTGGVGAMMWNADDTTERFNAGDTVKLQWTTRLGRGRLLFSDMGRVLVSIIGDTIGRHDALLGGAYRAGGRTTRDNFRLAAAKLGMDRRDIPPCMTFFAPIAVAEDGALSWQDGLVQPGQHLDLRAEMDLVLTVSNCTHPLCPELEARGSIEMIVWQAPPANAADECRVLTEEAMRGFQNTDGAL